MLIVVLAINRACKNQVGRQRTARRTPRDFLDRHPVPSHNSEATKMYSAVSGILGTATASSPHRHRHTTMLGSSTMTLAFQAAVAKVSRHLAGILLVGLPGDEIRGVARDVYLCIARSRVCRCSPSIVIFRLTLSVGLGANDLKTLRIMAIDSMISFSTSSMLYPCLIDSLSE